jgi:hypothetical protein
MFLGLENTGRNNRETQMNISVDETLAQRGQVYGDYEDVASRSQKIKTVLRESKNWSRLSCVQKESLEMLANKMARILEGVDPDYHDSWHDISGYTGLVEQNLKKKNQRAQK